MNNRVAGTILVGLALTVAAGWCTRPAHPGSYAYYPATSGGSSGAGSITALLAFMIAGAALIGVVFFAPQLPKGPHTRNQLSPRYATRGLRIRRTPAFALSMVLLLVERARRGLADLHQELEVVLGLLQTVDQQIDRLVRVQAGKYAAQLVQHRCFVGAEQ